MKDTNLKKIFKQYKKINDLDFPPNKRFYIQRNIKNKSMKIKKRI